MKTSIDLSEIESYRICPEKERRRKVTPLTPLEKLESQYLSRLRDLLVRYFTELASNNILTEVDLRRAWSTMWDIPVVTNRIYNPSEMSHKATSVDRMMTDEERLCVRGAGVIHRFIERKMNLQVLPVIVDEPFDLALGDIRITGKYDLVFQDRSGRYWLVEWTNKYEKYDLKQDLKHTVMIKAFKDRFGQNSTVLVDYIRTFGTHGDYIEKSSRTEEQLNKQLLELEQLTKSISQDIYYRSIGPACKECIYKSPCLGEKIEVKKRTAVQKIGTHTRKHIVS